MERKFYVLVPVYNAEKYIDACIRSVLEQTYDNFKLIIVDDGTPDRAGQICDGYASQDARIEVIHKPNGGLISARRAAISAMLRQAQPEDFAVFLDSDDTLKPQTLQVLRDTIQAQDCDMVIYGMDRVFEGKILEPFQPRKSFIGVIEERRKLYRTVFLSSAYNPLCRKAVRAELLSDDDYSVYYHIRQGEDLLQSVPLYGKCRKAAFIRDSLYNYTFNPDSISNTYRYENYRIDSTVRRTVSVLLEAEPTWTEEDQAAYMAYCRERVVNLLTRIASFQTEKKNKIGLFRDVAADECYSKILATAQISDKALCLLREEKYDRLLGILRTKNAVLRLKHRIKRMLAR